MAYIFEALTASIFGLLLGSFAGAQVWRIRARQLDEDRRAGETIDKQELSRLKPLISVSLTSDRSVCLSCHHQLRWYDMIPLLSWASTGGRCRYCQQPIGSLEPLIELGLSAAFVISYLYWPTALTSGVAWGAFVVWLLSLTSLAILVTYDIRWQLLPDIVSYCYMLLGIIFIVLGFHGGWGSIVEVVGAVAVLGGLYGILYLLSGGRWIGFGDVKLGVGLGLFLSNWRQALLALFLANLIGCIVVIPGLISRKLTSTSHIPFGPFLVAGMMLAFFWGEWLISRLLSLQLF